MFMQISYILLKVCEQNVIELGSMEICQGRKNLMIFMNFIMDMGEW